MKQKLSYPQNWQLYNLSQTKEKMLFLKIINDAVNYLNIPYEYQGNGRPRIGLDDMIKCCCIKVFNCFSTRRTIYELQIAHALGYIRKIPHFNSISNYMIDPRITQHLHNLYKLLSMPLVNAENNFAVDATGFSTFNKKKWFEIRMNYKETKDYKKLHIISGVRTNVITSARVSQGNRNDSPYFAELVKETSFSFRIKQISADSGYLSRNNCDVVEEVGGQPFILPKTNTTTKSYGSGAWSRMIRLWEANMPLFAEHYHKRSNVEATFSMMKRKFLPYVRSKNDDSQFNEILCKVVCHNASVLVNSMFELNIDINFHEGG